MATIRKRQKKSGVSYQVQVRLKDGGFENATFQSLTKAKLWASSIETAIREGRHFKGKAGKIYTLNDLSKRFLEHPSLKPKTKIQYGPQLKWWTGQLGYKCLTDITADQISRSRDKLLQQGLSQSSANRYVSALSSAFSVAVKEYEWVETNPCLRLKKLAEPNGRKRFLSDVERQRLLEECKKSDVHQLYIIVVLALSTGARKNELRWLRWSDVDLTVGMLIFRDTKNGLTRSVPILSQGIELLRDWSMHKENENDLVFPGKNPESPLIFEKSWKTVLKKAGIEDFRFHDLRHSSASYLIMNGVHLRTVAEILGHKTLSMVQRYSHLSPEHLRSDISKTLQNINL